MRLKIFVLPLLISVTSCSSSNFPKSSLLGGLRVLALVVNQPYIANPSGNTTVMLTPYVSDIGGTGNLTVAIQSCVDPGVAAGGPAPDCTNGVNASAVQNVTITASTGQPAGTFGNPERSGAPASAISVPLNIPANFLSAYSQQLQFNGVPYIITFTISNATSTLTAYRQVYISNQATDTNPTLGDLLAGGTSLTSLPVANVALSASITSTPATYQLMSSSGTVSTAVQNYSTNWFASDGSLDSGSTNATGTDLWTVPGAEPTGRKAVVIGVLRNGRGGESVIVRLL